MKTYNIVNLLVNDDQSDPSTAFDYSFTFNDEEGNVITLYTFQDFLTMMCNKYNSFYVLCPRYYDDDAREFIEMVKDRDEAIDYLHKIYDLWRKDRLPAITKLWEALRSKYNPLWNVDGVDGYVSKDTHTGTDIIAHKGNNRTETEDNGSVTRSGSESDTAGGNDTGIGSNTTYNSSTFYDNGKQTMQYGRTDTHTYNSVRDTRDLDGSSQTTFNSSDENTKNLTDNHVDLRVRQGNIGVTSTQSLILQSFQVADKDSLIDMVINDFVHSNLITY